MQAAIDRLMGADSGLGRTDALVVRQGGETRLERYRDGVDATTTLRSWSMAKSMLHAAVGLLVDEGVLDPTARAPVARWSDPDDPRHAITLGHLLTMRSGLVWTEEPVDGHLPDVVTMVYGNDRGPMPDTADWAADRPLEHAPGSVLRYSSGSSAIVSAIVRDVVGAGPAYDQWLRDRLFGPVGMASAVPKFDPSGSWMATTFCFCSARDFARFGELYLRGGRCDAGQLLSAGWVDTAARETGRDGLGRIHTMHWWRFGDDPWGAYFASGYLGQYIVVVPPLDLVVVRLGETPTEQRTHVHDALSELIASFDR